MCLGAASSARFISEHRGALQLALALKCRFVWFMTLHSSDYVMNFNVSKFIKSACNEERYAKIISKRKESERQRAWYRDDTVDGDIGNRL